MTEKIPDADYIREAERLGMPPYKFDRPDYNFVIMLLKEADEQIDELVETLIAVDDRLTRVGDDEQFKEQINKIEDIGCDVRHLIRELRS